MTELPNNDASRACPRWVTAVAMLLSSAIVYLPAALGAELLQFDDNFFFGPDPTDNAVMREGLGAVLTQPIANAYLPVAHASLWLDWAVFRDAPFWPHLHALLLHGLCGVVLARLLLRLGAGFAAAHVAGLLFVAHPALAESVAWVSGRKDVLSGLFVLLALHAAVAFARRPGALPAAAIALCTALAMYAKATAVVAPLAALVVVWWAGGARARWLAPALSLLVALPIALHHQAIAADEGTLAAGDAATRLAQVPGAFWHYLTTALWPVRLNVLYPEVSTLEAFRAARTPGVVALVALALVVALAAWRPRTRALAAGLLLFVLALLPFNTAYPASSIAAADRYLYLAIPGLALAAVGALRAVGPRAPWFAAALAAPCVWLAAGRAHDFRDDATLWRSSLTVETRNAVAHLNLVYDRLRRGAAPVDEVRPHLDAAVGAADYPIHALRAHTLLRQLALAEADYEAAARHAEAAVEAAVAQRARETAPRRVAQADALLLQARLDAFEPLQLAGADRAADAMLAAAQAEAPLHPDVVAFAAMRELAQLQPELLALAAAGKAPRLADDDPRGAAVDARLAAAREAHPTHGGLWLAQALWDQARERVLASMRAYLRAQELTPDSVAAWLGAARLMRERRSWEDAIRHARGGLARRPDPRLRQELALALVGLGDLDSAELQLEAYLKVRPDDRDSAKILANLLIGRAYARLGDRAARGEVQRLIDRALAYNPDEAKALVLLGRLAHEDRRFADAVRHLELACRLLPDYVDAREQYARSLAALGYDHLLRRDDDAAIAAFCRCREVAPPGFDLDAIQGQLELAWERFEARGVKRLGDGDRDGAIADFRRCLTIDPEHHWASWLLATALHGQPGCDVVELERLCREAVRWQEKNGQDASRQVWLLASTLHQSGREQEARELASAYVAKPSPDADPSVLAALQRLAAR